MVHVGDGNGDNLFNLYRADLTIGEVIGYTFRAIGHFHPTNFIVFLINQIFIVLPHFFLLIPGIGAYILSCNELCHPWPSPSFNA